jgi:ubiquinone/menaquinone biosynthesis C-methylase UbiE
VGTNEGVKSIFDKFANQYNQSRRKLIPCFDDFYRIAVEIIPFQHQANIKVLDLGAGTGLFSSLVASAYKNAEITLHHKERVDICDDLDASAADFSLVFKQ